MKLYLIGGVYVGTQKEGQAEAKKQGVKFDPETHAEEVPTRSKEELIDYLNGLGTVRPQQDQFQTVAERQDPPIDEDDDRPDTGDATLDSVLVFVAGAPVWAFKRVFNAVNTRASTFFEAAFDKLLDDKRETKPDNGPDVASLMS